MSIELHCKKRKGPEDELLKGFSKKIKIIDVNEPPMMKNLDLKLEESIPLKDVLKISEEKDIKIKLLEDRIVKLELEIVCVKKRFDIIDAQKKREEDYYYQSVLI